MACRIQAGCTLAAFLALLPAAPAADRGRQKTVDYNWDIRPILSKNCFACHGSDERHREAGLRLDRRESAITPLKSQKTAIVPGDAARSELIRRITCPDPDDRMPPASSGNHLGKGQIELIRRWIEQGANYAEHWSYVKPRRWPLPEVHDPAWPINGIDHFILARLEEEGLKPSPPAGRYALLRRLSFDLRGLPPSPEEVDAFAGDPSAEAYEKAVDRFLGDPAYGERWARLWLDLARYADSAGYGSDPLRLNIWPYRDWVIEAFNRNLPFDQFTIEQLAGDLLPNPTLEQRIATAFHRNTLTNTEGGTDDEEFRVAAVRDRVDSTVQAWMGLTMGCAKCHSHKYDPITNQEYYQFYAFLNQTADADRSDEAPLLEVPPRHLEKQIEETNARIAQLKKQFESAEWRVLKPLEAKAKSGVEPRLLEDGSILVTNPSKEPEVYTVTAKTDLQGITAFRLEAIPDGSLPVGGSGRGGDGNFILSRFSVAAGAPEGSARKLSGRFVRIELPGERRILSLAEVEVYSGGADLARAGSADQSSTDYDGPAALAIDGNTDGRYAEAKSTTHTKNEKDPWWEVDLGEAKPIDQIVIWNRADGGAEITKRLSGFRLLVLDGARAAVWQEERAGAPDPSASFSTSGRRSVPFALAAADFSQEGFPVQNALKQKDLKESGWSVGLRQKEPHAAVFVAASPVAAADGEKETALSFQLEHLFKDPQYSLGRFRLSATSAPVKAAIEEIAKLESSRPKPAMLPVMVELEGKDRRQTRVQIKGNFLNPGEEVEPGVPAAFHPLLPDAPRNRLSLARWLVDEENPLTARVLVNRLWAQLFGLGLVETQEDFGAQGEPPSHPKLLDWLAVEFLSPLSPGARKWDVKAILRLMVTSQTYRQSARVTPDLLQKDPRNRLLSRGPRLRLEAEMVRDQALALSGLLSRKLYGPSVYPPQPPGLWQAAFNGERTWPTSAGEDRYRRGLYTFWRRTVPYPSMATFDAPSRELCTFRRINTNTPLQAFVTMNDPVYVEASQALARRIFKSGGASVEDRARYGLKLCLARPPEAEQIESLAELYRSELEHYSREPEAAAKLAADPLGPLPEGMAAPELAAWTVAANVLLNLDGVLTK
ncbi:MAG: DUF1553 domain-containing protein [Planctomycetes bacterium]|nr:DUF1553 domain-containing protein [Planctomycetota bacterium]